MIIDTKAKTLFFLLTNKIKVLARDLKNQINPLLRLVLM